MEEEYLVIGDPKYAYDDSVHFAPESGITLADTSYTSTYGRVCEVFLVLNVSRTSGWMKVGTLSKGPVSMRYLSAFDGGGSVYDGLSRVDANGEVFIYSRSAGNATVVISDTFISEN